MSAKIEICADAVKVMLAHALKYHQSSCLGVLLGNCAEQGHYKIEKAIPLFHDHVFASTLEAAFNAVSHLYPEDQILGVYDAPIKFKPGESIPVSSVATSLCE